VAESLDWAAALAMLSRDSLEPEALQSTISVLLKHYEDQRRFKSKWLPALLETLGTVEPGNEASWLEQTYQQVARA
jgi:hypothetical protein